MSSAFNYDDENNKKYKIIFQCPDDNIELTIVRLDNGDIYRSNYDLDNLNQKFFGVIKFKSSKDFINCCNDNINKKTLKLKSPYKSVIKSIWNIFPNDDKKKNTFTLVSSKSADKNISLFCYSEYYMTKNLVEEIQKQLSVEINKTELNDPKSNYNIIRFKENKILDKIYYLKENYKDEKEKEKYFTNILESNKDDEFGFRKLLILFDEENILDFLLNIVKKFYQNQIFVLFFTEKNIDDFRIEINKKLSKLKETHLCYFDSNNVFIYDNSLEGYKNSIISLIKVYSYFNQLGDGYYKYLYEKKMKIEGLDYEVSHLYLTHYFNILLYGRTGTGKSTFINRVMGEKKSFTLKTKSIGTERNNYYIHRKYPIKMLDVCGFAEGNEARENLEKINLIYKKESTNIIIDEPTNDVFSFYGDKRNNIHLLIYFNVYDDRYDIFPGELPFMYDAVEKKIPIIFVVNKCPDDIFEDEEELELLKNEVREGRKGDFENYDTYYINCINGNGFPQLLQGIFNQFNKYIIKEQDLNSIRNLTMPTQKFNDLFEHSFFFGDISPKDNFLNESLIQSVLDIKKLIVELAGYYSNELGFIDSLSFLFTKRLYNQFWRAADKNLFPLLTNLVKKIYSNFGYEKSYEECNKFIKVKLSEYFNLNNDGENGVNMPKALPPKKDDDITATVEDDNPAPYHFNIAQFKKDYSALVRLYWYSKNNFRLDDKLETSKLKANSNIENKIFNFEGDNDITAERLLTLIKRDFGLDNSKRDATDKEKIFQKLFYISYICNELISSLCGNINQKGFKYTSIYNFYYTVSLTYNKAIKGFLSINEDMKNKMKLKKKKKTEVDDNEDAPPVNA